MSEHQSGHSDAPAPVPSDTGGGQEGATASDAVLSHIPLDHEPSEHDIDKMIEEQDPEFAAKMNDLAKQKLDIADDQENLSEALKEETSRWETAGGLRKKLYKYLHFLPRLSLGLRRFRHWAMVKVTRLLISAKNWFHDVGILIWKSSLTTGKASGKAIQAGLSKFGKTIKGMGWRRQLALLATLVFVGAILYGVKWTFSGRLLPGEKALFIANFAEEGAEVFEFDSSEKQELFYDNIRSTPNLLHLPKMVVNLRPGGDSGSNPMLAVDFFAEGQSPEPILEIKEREGFFRDLMQRKMEEYSFDTLDSPTGKQALAQDLLADLNRNLRQGRLRALRIKTIVLKP